MRALGTGVQNTVVQLEPDFMVPRRKESVFTWKESVFTWRESLFTLQGKKTSSSQPLSWQVSWTRVPFEYSMKLLTPCFQEPCLIPDKCTVQGPDWEAASQQPFLFLEYGLLSLWCLSRGTEAQRHTGSCLTWELTGHSAQGDRGWLQWHRAFFQKNQPVCCVSLLWVLEPPQRVLNNKVLGITLQWVIKGCDFSFLPHLVQHNGGEDLGHAGNSVGEETFGEI